MKFCKNLQRVVDISDPEWAPYYPNYKMLKKLIKELPSLVPADDKAPRGGRCSPSSSVDTSSSSTHAATTATEQQQHGDNTAETVNESKNESQSQQQHQSPESQASVPNTSKAQPQQPQPAAQTGQDGIGKSPGEVAFFKLLHSEFKKATHFFEKATEEFSIREERVREGMTIMQQPNSIMVNEKWSLMAKSIFRLYKDLSLLETFAIMTYCSFSKILKKHDKVTGYDTRVAFMANIVNKANFTHYPEVTAMIPRCEQLYEQVSSNLLREGKEGLYEDERLFINMIHRLNEQVLSSDDNEVMNKNEKRNEGAGRRRSLDTSSPGRTAPSSSAKTSTTHSPADKQETKAATLTLRKLVEENDKINQPSASKVQVSEGAEDEDSGEETHHTDKRGAAVPTTQSTGNKRQRKS